MSTRIGDFCAATSVELDIQCGWCVRAPFRQWEWRVHCARCGEPSAVSVRQAQLTTERWSMGFVHDQLSEGAPFRVLTVVDQFSRQAPVREVQHGLGSHDIVAALDRRVEHK
jgi:hypothetical protein